MINKSSRKLLERKCIMYSEKHKDHIYTYVSETKTKIRMKCFACADEEEISNVLEIKFDKKLKGLLKNKAGKMSGFLSFFLIILIALFILFVVATGIIIKWG